MIPNLLVFSETCNEKQKKIKSTLIYGQEYISHIPHISGDLEIYPLAAGLSCSLKCTYTLHSLQENPPIYCVRFFLKK